MIEDSLVMTNQWRHYSTPCSYVARTPADFLVSGDPFLASERERSEMRVRIQLVILVCLEKVSWRSVYDRPSDLYPRDMEV